MPGKRVGLAVGAFVATLALAPTGAGAGVAAPLGVTQTATACGGVAPDMAACTVGHVGPLLFNSVSFGFGADFVGRLSMRFVYDPPAPGLPAKDDSVWCADVDNLRHDWPDCPMQGSDPLYGESFTVHCLVTAFRSDAGEGSGSWDCSYRRYQLPAPTLPGPA